jgi:hypothetical protein
MYWEELCRPNGQDAELTMIKSPTLSRAEIESFDRFYREGGLRAMASPHVHYDDPACPHAGCSQRLEWIDFKLELHGDPEGIYKPLVRSWWEGTGFVGRCPGCQGLIQFTTLGMAAPDEESSRRLPQLPENWAAIAQIA